MITFLNSTPKTTANNGVYVFCWLDVLKVMNSKLSFQILVKSD